MHVKIFDGECDGGKEEKMFEGRGAGDNDGTAEEQASKCSEACLTNKNFDWKGFIVRPTDGRCFCETADSTTCSRYRGQWALHYDRYDWTSMPRIPNTSCNSHHIEGGGKYGTRALAEAACLETGACSGVNDCNCDGLKTSSDICEDFQMCDKDHEFTSSSAGSCVYAKPGVCKHARG